MGLPINKRVIDKAQLDVLPSALDLTPHLLSDETLVTVDVSADNSVTQLTVPGAIESTDTPYGKTNRVMKAGKWLSWTYQILAGTSGDIGTIQINFVTSKGQNRNLELKIRRI